MEEQPKREQLRSFDVLASVDMMRFDLQQHGYVLPETRQRVYDEELSSIAEGAERASRTEFVLAREGEDLVYFDRGEWRSYTGMLITGNQVAHEEARQDSRRQFLAEWSDRDLHIGYRLRNMQPGETMTWTNAYPHEQERVHGARFLQECGLNPKRKMGFIYRAVCLEDGSVALESQTIDGGYMDGFAAVEETATVEPDATMESLVAAYDSAVLQKTGEWVYAGRTAAEINENAWDEIISHKDLIEGLLDGLERIAGQDGSRAVIERQTREHIIGSWKAFKMRLHRHTPTARRSVQHGLPVGDVQAEIRNAYQLAQSQGEVKVGCGGMVIAADEKSPAPVDMKSTFDAIFGNPDSSESKGSWKWKDGICRVDACPTRPGKTKVGPCEVCVRCQAKFDAGEDPTKSVTRPPERKPKSELYAELADIWKKALGAENKKPVELAA